ncbi:MAG TPA: dTMP kinase [Pseudonocardiaceae bacterium]|jgi:dTMP kinase|nr:dTMP kinase [Pseudonocardiaceae bacterium]
MGSLVVVEGLDGAGKRTLTDALCAALRAKGARIAQLAFPRYEADLHAQLVRDALHGRLGDLSESVHGMAVLYALDRLGARESMLADLAEHDILLVDRYIASNAAYGAARLHQTWDGEFTHWLTDLELGRFGLLVPDLHLLLRVPVDVAADRAARRERSEPGRQRDKFESDEGLQARCGVVYDQLAANSWLAPWEVLDGAAGTDTDALAARLLELPAQR